MKIAFYIERNNLRLRQERNEKPAVFDTDLDAPYYSARPLLFLNVNTISGIALWKSTCRRIENGTQCVSNWNELERMDKTCIGWFMSVRTQGRDFRPTLQGEKRRRCDHGHIPPSLGKSDSLWKRRCRMRVYFSRNLLTGIPRFRDVHLPPPLQIGF